MFVPHRFKTNEGVKKVKGKTLIINKIKKKCKIREQNLISQLQELGYNDELILKSISYLEYYDLNAALMVISELLENPNQYM